MILLVLFCWMSNALATEAPLEGRVAVGPPLSHIRVLVFPHLGHYARPHGRETVIETVRVRYAGSDPAGRCRAYRPSAADPALVGRELVLEAATLTQSLRIECEGPVQVLRDPGQAVRSYLGTLHARAALTPEGLPYVELVHRVAFEDYLKGVVPGEIPASWHSEALQAQAVAARSYAYFQAQRARSAPFRTYDVDDTILYQAYLGHGARWPSTDAAVDATTGELLVYEGRVVKAYFHADSGGHTEDAANIWTGDAGNAPYCRGKAEAYDPSLIDSRWTTSRTLEELERALKAVGQLQPQQVLVDVRNDSSLYPSGRPRRVILELAGGQALSIPAERFRYAAALRSPWFTVHPVEATGFPITGLGYGHGVGMSQWGAQLSARTLGWSYQQILEFYYTGSSVRN